MDKNLFWPVWLEEARAGFSKDEWQQVTNLSGDQIRALKDQPGTTLIRGVAVHYRLHAHEMEEDRREARTLDALVFDNTVEALFGTPLFECSPDIIAFPEPSAPFIYPPYKTRRNVRDLLERRPDHGIWLDPHNHYSIPLEGREIEQKRLTAFMDKPDPFRILPVIGPAGAGKTRLISEWMKPYVPIEGAGTSWDAGLLTSEISTGGMSNARDPRRWYDWNIQRDTLIVIDYTHAFDEVARAIFEKATAQLVHRIRLIVIDHVFPDFLEEDFFWQRVGDGSFSRISQIETNYLEAPLFLHEGEKDGRSIKQVITSSANIGREYPIYTTDHPNVSAASEKLTTIFASGRIENVERHPLFAALLGQVIRESGDASPDFSNINRHDLIRNFLSSTDRFPWKGWRGHPSVDTRRADGLLIGALVSVAVLRRGLPNSDAERHIRGRQDIIQRAKRIVSSEDLDQINPLQPDILGEAFMLHFLDEVRDSPDVFADFLSILSNSEYLTEEEIAQNFHETVGRAARNLSNDDPNRTAVHSDWKALGRVDKRDSQVGSGVLQDSFLRGGNLGTETDVGRRVVVL
ncbi:MAG: hypothetical protein AAGI03_06195 [Pseudomonadota bacterium]